MFPAGRKRARVEERKTASLVSASLLIYQTSPLRTELGTQDDLSPMLVAQKTEAASRVAWGRCLPMCTLETLQRYSPGFMLMYYH